MGAFSEPVEHFIVNHFTGAPNNVNFYRDLINRIRIWDWIFVFIIILVSILIFIDLQVSVWESYYNSRLWKIINKMG